MGQRGRPSTSEATLTFFLPCFMPGDGSAVVRATALQTSPGRATGTPAPGGRGGSRGRSPSTGGQRVSPLICLWRRSGTVWLSDPSCLAAGVAGGSQQRQSQNGAAVAGRPRPEGPRRGHRDRPAHRGWQRQIRGLTRLAQHSPASPSRLRAGGLGRPHQCRQVRRSAWQRGANCRSPAKLATGVGYRRPLPARRQPSARRQTQRHWRPHDAPCMPALISPPPRAPAPWCRRGRG